jgi:hypothetical protein
MRKNRDEADNCQIREAGCGVVRKMAIFSIAYAVLYPNDFK